MNTTKILIHNEKRHAVLHEQDIMTTFHLPAGNVEGNPLVSDVLQNTAIKPTNKAIKPPNAKNGLEVVDETQHFASC